jgi:hypothetical protein
MFDYARTHDLPFITRLLPELYKKGLSLVGEKVAWMQGREWEEGRLKAQLYNSVYYEILPDESHKDKLVSGLFPLAELQMFLEDKGPIIRGTPEQIVLEGIFTPRDRERRT